MSSQNLLRTPSSSHLFARLGLRPAHGTKWARIGAALSVLALAATAGCSSETNGASSTSTSSSAASSGAGGTSSSSTTGSGSGDGGSGGGAAVECEPTKNAGTPADVMVKSAEATVVDIANAPIANSQIQLCGLNLCLNGETGPDGHVLVPAGDKKLTSPAFKYGDGLLTGKFAVPVKDAVTTLGTIVTARLPAMGAPLVAGKDVTSGGVTLTIPAGAGIEIDVLIYDKPATQGFRAASVPVDKALPALDKTLKLEMLFVASPVDTIFCPAVGVSVPNTEMWPAGTEVEFFIHGVGIEEYYVPYGGWAKISDGAVSADGKTITTAAGGGLPILTAFGVRKK